MKDSARRPQKPFYLYQDMLQTPNKVLDLLDQMPEGR